MTPTVARTRAEALEPTLRALAPPGCAFACMEIDDHTDQLHALESGAIAASVTKRRNEFATGRMCARAALSQFGLAHLPVPVGSRRQPIWPAGIVGSITHTDGVAAALTMRGLPGEGIGIDIERWAGVSTAVLRTITSSRELERAEAHGSPARLPGMVFAAKESAFKALDGGGYRPLGFRELEVRLAPDGARFRILWRKSAVPLLPQVDGRLAVVGDLMVAIATCRRC